MAHSFWYIIGFLCGLAVVALIGVILIKRHGHPQYDKRQELARGKAFKAAFFILLYYLTVTGILDLVWGIRFGDSFTNSFLGICLAAAVFACSCIRHDAYFSVNNKPRSAVILTAINGTISVLNLLRYGFLPGGVLTTDSMNLICGTMSLVILIAILLKLAQDRRTVQE